MKADCLEHRGRRVNMNIFGVPEEEANEPFKEVTKMAAKGGISSSKEEISVAHRLPTRKVDQRLLVAKFVQREFKCRIKAKTALKLEDSSTEPKIFKNDDITLLPAKNPKLRQTW